MKTELIPFTKDMLPEAGALLAVRHQRNREKLPVLPRRFEKREVAIKAIESLLEGKTSRGYAARRNGKMVAYFLGTTTIQPWGRCGWAYLAGSALAESENLETLQDLYVLLGDDWVREGVYIHHTYLSQADTDLVEAWFGLDFGKERIDGVFEFSEVEIPEIHVPDRIHIRRAVPGDNEHLASMSHLIMRELEKSPYWHPTSPEEFIEIREGWAELADNKYVNAWLALDGDKTVGTIASWKEDENATNMLISPKMFGNSVAATRPEWRERGIGTALAWTCFSYNRELGYKSCYTSWISPNLSASRFWPRFGFKEVAYRLTKNINPMIARTRS